MKITVTRALAEVKSLQNRIDKAIMKVAPFEVSVGERLKGEHSSMKIEDWEKDAKEEFQSLSSLISRQAAIKIAIDKSNHETKVKICGKEMTIAEVLIEKSLVLPNEESMKKALEKELVIKKRVFDAALEENKARIEKMVDGEISSSASSGKVSKAERDDIVSKYTDMVEKTSKVELRDPVKAQDWIKEKEEKIAEYKNEVDYILSESNSTTFIEIPD